jgi:hypothetical protein
MLQKKPNKSNWLENNKNNAMNYEGFVVAISINMELGEVVICRN